MNWALFEGSQHEEFAPLSLTRALFDIKVGAKSRFEQFPEKPGLLFNRDYLQKVTEERHPSCGVNSSSFDSDTIFVNGLADSRILDLDRLLTASRFIALAGGEIVAARLTKKDSEELADSVISGRRPAHKKFNVDKSFELPATQTRMPDRLWQLIGGLDSALSKDMQTGEGNKQYKFIGKDPPLIHPTAQVEEGAVFDTTKGQIQIGREARIGPCRIVGPAAIGNKTVVKQFSIIESSAIGAECRVAGEIEHSILCDFVNKAHAGFVGHSYVGEWVNLGAMTTTSDLKLTYGEIKMTSSGRKISTGMNKLGAFFGDMVKTSIGTLVYGGLRIGTGSHLIGTISSDVPSFSIASSERLVELELESAIRTQERMMPRRNMTMTKAYKKMIEAVFAKTASERKRSRVKKARFSG